MYNEQVKEGLKNRHKISLVKKGVVFIGALFILLLIAIISITGYFFITTNSQILNKENSEVNPEYILILGCGLNGDEPSWMLRNRLDAGLKAFEDLNAKKIILSGSKNGSYYDEVRVMKKYIMGKNISEEVIIEDKFGNDTYDSVYNAIKNGYSDGIVIVTQETHLRRALFIANSLKAKRVWGYPADPIGHYPSMAHMQFRELFARIKAIMDVWGLQIDL